MISSVFNNKNLVKMTNIEKIEFIDEFLSELEDVLHGIEGRDCTKSRKYLDELKQAINYNLNCKELCDEKDKVFICENEYCMLRKCKKCGNIT